MQDAPVSVTHASRPLITPVSYNLHQKYMYVSITYIMITILFSIVILSFTSRKNEISRSVVDTGDICVFQNLRSTKHDIH